jgi:hypothetical protein
MGSIGADMILASADFPNWFSAAYTSENFDYGCYRKFITLIVTHITLYNNISS